MQTVLDHISGKIHFQIPVQQDIVAHANSNYQSKFNFLAIELFSPTQRIAGNFMNATLGIYFTLL